MRLGEEGDNWGIERGSEGKWYGGRGRRLGGGNLSQASNTSHYFHGLSEAELMVEKVAVDGAVQGTQVQLLSGHFNILIHT